jgi:hypothetical protein
LPPLTSSTAASPMIRFMVRSLHACRLIRQFRYCDYSTPRRAGAHRVKHAIVARTSGQGE